MYFRSRAIRLSLTAALMLVAVSTRSAENVVEVTIKEHRFDPSEIRIKADTKVKLQISNLDPTPEEFESYELKREKVIAGNAKAIIFVGPLKPGSYPFFGEFNQATAQGRIIVE